MWGVAKSIFGSCVVEFQSDFVLSKLYFTEFDSSSDLARNLVGERDDHKATIVSDYLFGNKDLCGLFGKSDMSGVLPTKGLDRDVTLALKAIPRGETRTYTQIAAAIGRPKAVRAVASAIGRNEISFVVPCHRVIRSDGSMGGYRWGLDIKKALLEWEQI